MVQILPIEPRAFSNLNGLDLDIGDLRLTMKLFTGYSLSGEKCRAVDKSMRSLVESNRELLVENYLLGSVEFRALKF